MEFHFSLRNALKESWELFKRHTALFIVLSLVLFLLQMVTRSKHVQDALLFIVGIASLVWSFVYIKIVLAVLDGKDVPLTIGSIQKNLPGLKNFFSLIGVAILMTVIVICGFIMLIIPGFYFMIRLCFSNFSYIDHEKGVIGALKHSWQITKGDAAWTIILAILIVLGIMIFGIVLFGIGLLIAYPVGIIFFAKLYRALEHRHHKAAQHIEQVREEEYS